jgi:hypothetical protein
MRISSLLGRILMLSLMAVFSLCLEQSAFAGIVVSWGSMKTINDDLTDVSAVAAGYNHSLALKFDGSIIGWGEDYYGQATPPYGNDFVAIAASSALSLALKSDGSIVGWGWDNYGQATPPEGNDFVAISSGGLYNWALKSDGSIVSWGWDYDSHTTPPSGNDFVAIAISFWHNLALKSDGSIVGQGLNTYGQATPPEGNDFVAIAVGGYHSLALKSDGTIFGWGDNDYGQSTPPAGNNFVAIAAGWLHSLALRSDGTIFCWGDDNYGQATPPAGNDFVAIAASGYYGTICGSYSMAIKREPPIEATMRFTPHALSCKSRGILVKAHFVLPEGITVEDVDTNISGEIESLGIKAESMHIFVGEDGLERLDMVFDRTALCDGLNDSGSLEITVRGFLTKDRCFYGTETIKIVDNIFEYLAFISSQWLKADCSDPDWCQGADIDRDSVVNLYDFAFMAYQWLEDNRE